MEKLMRTKKYELFENSLVNRDIQKLKKLLVSMEKYGFDQRFPIAVRRNGNGKFDILDGHRRFEAAKQLDIELFFVSSETEIDLRDFTETVEKWTLADYANSYVREGNRQYIALKDFRDRNKHLPLAVCARLLHGELARSASADNHVKRGTFKVRNPAFAQKVADIIGAIRPVIPLATHSDFINAISRVAILPDFDVPRFVHNAKRCASWFVPKASLNDYMELLEAVYNDHMGAKSRVPLKFQSDIAANARAVTVKKVAA